MKSNMFVSFPKLVPRLGVDGDFKISKLVKGKSLGRNLILSYIEIHAVKTVLIAWYHEIPPPILIPFTWSWINNSCFSKWYRIPVRFLQYSWHLFRKFTWSLRTTLASSNGTEVLSLLCFPSQNTPMTHRKCHREQIDSSTLFACCI